MEPGSNQNEEKKMNYKLSALTDCELLIMLCIWNSEEAINVHQIQEKITRYDKNYKPTTIYTILTQIEKKEYVQRYKKGAAYFYALVSKKEYLQELVNNMKILFDEESLEIFLTGSK